MRYFFAILLIYMSLVCVCCSKGDENNGMTAKAYYKEAYQFIDAGHPKEAIDLLDLAIKKDPNYYEAYYNRGVVYYLMKEYRSAIDDFSKAISIDPKNSSAYASRGEVYEVLKDNEKAYSDYKTAARMGNEEAQKYLKSKKMAW